ncbi:MULTISPECIES: 2-haloalkanoic acid dehalogenase [unclassified Pseudomonas]|uniref:2-haloalkanoic acid dehalogenase n=1 Tax=unclassified Pseudomonas TaxID=196821 RepID=UPI000C86E441|nr:MULTISPECIES: 2-haloalkanoic acid dehalogenase [unclassified Pseudomonas]PMV22752.1 2-haloalkanoic acid dehalogenase [Pseudomonas sp. FW305-3-2-15-C-TSA2]PMV29415.1 2-haloalkanoic acid dehalogenase [Pseudomonas sp. DP16D-L5]PMV39318.1 2-haloalkanoic acid dehalogenase [Pseudomonas sp. FW305-3-2-15-A-LB2]PMV45628.1 2-haloalkanoic acid dehalogenase [Pseudomonas sp. FW305-3-2-15-C-R2A1]PMV51929.1 2-haloalkanoic acid dehalogenase [Pseudomonas sp. FW305-3-2-15-C-LB1]
MGLTDYRTLLIDCDEVLVDRDSGVWAALQPLLDNRGGQPSREQVLTEFNAMVASLYPRFAELGFSGVLCFAHRQLAESWDLQASWEEGMSFARSASNWSLFEDSPGAMLYLRKFYCLLVRGDRDAEDRSGLCERLGIAPEDFISLAEDPQWLSRQGVDELPILHVTRPSVGAQVALDRCLIGRNRARQPSPCAADYCISSMADLVAQHQLSLRR